jgi:hypothetical protein
MWYQRLFQCPASQSQSHIATDGQSISKSWCRAPSGAHDQIFIAVWQLRSCFLWVCLLYMLLALASVVFLGSESLGTSDHILLSQIWDLPFRRLLRLAGSRWSYSNPPPHGSSKSITSPFITWCVPQTEHTLERFVCCNLRIHCHGNVCLWYRCPATVYSALPRECA